MTSQTRSTKWTKSSQPATTARALGWSFRSRESNAKNGTMKWPTTRSTETGFHAPRVRTRNHGTSSGRLAWYMSMYCENAM